MFLMKYVHTRFKELGRGNPMSKATQLQSLRAQKCCWENFYIAKTFNQNPGTGTQCRNYRILLSFLFDKNSVKSILSHWQIIINWFHEISYWSKFLVYSRCVKNYFTRHSVEIPWKYHYTKEFYSKLIWRKKLRGSECLVFPHCHQLNRMFRLPKTCNFP